MEAGRVQTWGGAIPVEGLEQGFPPSGRIERHPSAGLQICQQDSMPAGCSAAGSTNRMRRDTKTTKPWTQGIGVHEIAMHVGTDTEMGKEW